MYSEKVRQHFQRLRRQGKSLTELSSRFGISKSTASLWARETKMTQQGAQRLGKRSRQTTFRKGETQPHHQRQAEHREAAFQKGLRGRVTRQDALCVGLYWGEGSKWDRSWEFTNSDRETVHAMVEWAVHAGQPPQDFKARIQVHAEDEVTDEEIIRFWAGTGIAAQNIVVDRVVKKRKLARKNRLPYGTCRVRPIRNGVWLFNYYEGQRQALMAG